jgi:hypothetical protein
LRVAKAEYRSEDDRLVEWRRASLWRQRRLEDLAQIGDPDYHRRNLAAQPGASARVDSFLGTINTDDVEAAYAAPERVEAGGYRFRREDQSHPTLAVLRSRYALDEVAGAGDDLSRATRLRLWLKGRWPHRLPLSNPPYDGLVILDRAARGEAFICMHYSVALVHCCAAVGIDARVVNIHRGIAETYPIGEEASAGVNEHVTTEAYCRELERWVMIDPDFDCTFELRGEPLSAWDIHQAHVAGERVECAKGPGAAAYDSFGDDWYETTLSTFYAHVSLLMRNDFISDPDGPVPILHLVDEATPPILWYAGEDMRLRRDMLGPLVVAKPYTDRTPVLTDGSLESAWASDDTEHEHWVELTLSEEAAVGRIALHWPEWRSRFQTSSAYRIEGLVDGGWRTLAETESNPERPWTSHDFEPAATVASLRVVQPSGGGSPEHPNRLWLSQIELLR